MNSLIQRAAAAMAAAGSTQAKPDYRLIEDPQLPPHPAEKKYAWAPTEVHTSTSLSLSL